MTPHFAGKLCNNGQFLDLILEGGGRFELHEQTQCYAFGLVYPSQHNCNKTDMADKYNYLRLVGKGSFGKAWLVQSKSSQRQYVVKEIQVGNMADKDRHQAVNEVAILARLKHKNVVRYREAFVAAGTLNIVMAYANGGKKDY